MLVQEKSVARKNYNSRLIVQQTCVYHICRGAMDGGCSPRRISHRRPVYECVTIHLELSLLVFAAPRREGRLLCTWNYIMMYCVNRHVQQVQHTTWEAGLINASANQTTRSSLCASLRDYRLL